MVIFYYMSLSIIDDILWLTCFRSRDFFIPMAYIWYLLRVPKVDLLFDMGDLPLSV